MLENRWSFESRLFHWDQTTYFFTFFRQIELTDLVSVFVGKNSINRNEVHSPLPVQICFWRLLQLGANNAEVPVIHLSLNIIFSEGCASGWSWQTSSNTDYHQSIRPPKRNKGVHTNRHYLIHQRSLNSRFLKAFWRLFRFIALIYSWLQLIRQIKIFDCFNPLIAQIIRPIRCNAWEAFADNSAILLIQAWVCNYPPTNHLLLLVKHLSEITGLQFRQHCEVDHNPTKL